MRSAIAGNTYITRYAMIEADALALNPLAERLDFSKEARLAPGTAEEMDRLRASAMLHPR